MAIEIKVPSLGESVVEATVARWLKRPGEAVAADEPVVELETDKANVEVPAPAAGMLAEIAAAEGATLPVGGLLGRIGEAAVVPASRSTPLASGDRSEGPAPAPDVLPALSPPPAAASAASRQPPLAATPPTPQIGAREVRVPMTRLRRRIAERLKAAQNTAAILTTFNEIDMSQTIALREAWRDAFEKKHGVRLGFMSVFVKAAVAALKEIPGVNAEVDGDDIVYKNHYDIGVAVGTEHGLVVPVVRDADRLSFAEIEKEIAELGRKARDGKLAIEDLSGGTFTISNGGIYGSLLSTPILNPPQSGILGMHKIERRPVAVAGPGGLGETVEIRPMMYVALSYDHRIVDGREAVGFLVRVKELVEDPSRLLFEI